MKQENDEKVIIVDVLKDDQYSNLRKDEHTLYKRYTIAANNSLTVQMLLKEIYRNLDQGLAFRNYQCYMGICRNCMLKVNGKIVKACEMMVAPGERILVEPVTGDPKYKIRDLVCRWP